MLSRVSAAALRAARSVSSTSVAPVRAFTAATDDLKLDAKPKVQQSGSTRSGSNITHKTLTSDCATKHNNTPRWKAGQQHQELQNLPLES